MSHRCDNLMLTGVVAYCPDCGVEAVFVAPEVEEVHPAEHACTVCGAALLIELGESVEVVSVQGIA